MVTSARQSEPANADILGISTQEHFDPEQEFDNLIEILKKKSSVFYLKEVKCNYEHEDRIFFLAGPNQDKKSIKKCPSCLYAFQQTKEMVYCTFCGHSNDEKCMKKTRIYPYSHSKERGPICKLCDRKFLVHKQVADKYDYIKVAKKSLVDSISKLEKQGNVANAELENGGGDCDAKANQISKIDEQMREMKNDITRYKNDRKSKKESNTVVLNEKEKMEKQVKQMQQHTDTLENIYRELLGLTDEFKLIKKNELPSMLGDDNGQLSPSHFKRNKSDVMSDYSQDVEMMIDVPSIDDMDGGDGEENYEQGNMLSNMNDNMQTDERLDTLGSSRRSSVHSQASHNSNNLKQGGGQHNIKNNDIDLKRKRQMAPPTRTACCGAGDEGSCSIF